MQIQVASSSLTFVYISRLAINGFGFPKKKAYFIMCASVLLFRSLQESSISDFNKKVDPVNTYYVLNPQNNLDNTQKMFKKWFER